MDDDDDVGSTRDNDSFKLYYLVGRYSIQNYKISMNNLLWLTLNSIIENRLE